MPPAGATAPPVQAAFTAVVPPDSNGSSEFGGQMPETDRAGAPITISLGQTTDQVIALLGSPKSIVNLGSKRIYVYRDLKITFTNGEVSDVQ